MPNPNPKLENLKSYKPKWNFGKTKTIRVPTAIAEQILEIAHKIDRGEYNASISVTGDIINYNQAKNLLIAGLHAPANRGGEIKNCLAELGGLLGFKIDKQKNKWSVGDRQTNK